ncbi:MAG TPA: OmpA family protein [Novosphingobium sp.]|nr:OmpA family protein [Novosphingobium sp.]
MLDNWKWPASAVVLACALAPAAALAQQDAGDLMALDKGALRKEVKSRYDAAIAQTGNAGIVSADTPAFMWASQAKAQCGIALGFLKSGRKDPVSVGKCDDAYQRMNGVQTAAAEPLPAPPAPAAAPCLPGPYIVFFDWDSSEISPDAVTVLDSTVASTAGCGSSTIHVSGYADRSGGDRYNMGLSGRRADAVRAYLASHGTAAAVTTQAFGESNPRVPTADGVRELQNRRVEITVE